MISLRNAYVLGLLLREGADRNALACKRDVSAPYTDLKPRDVAPNKRMKMVLDEKKDCDIVSFFVK